ncbi:MAG TPA: efflux transporter outer membrane subunit [Verrucomicrobiae bacterium]|jgi:multidrug efflux system outer membrane protein|nr:efflux transporter outer membrane subunit [Verrucomicrobiae bacterium]
MRRLAPIGLALLLSACTLGPDYKRPEVNAPPDYRSAMAPPAERALGDLGWWQLYPDETLQALVREGLANNYDVRVAAARILDARAQVTIARSFQFPELRGSASAPYQRIQGDLSSLQARETFAPSGGLDLGYELDFWGRFRRGTEAARADLLATEYARRFVLTTLVSDLASAYFSLRALDEELVIARRTLDSRTQSLQLVKLREEGGVAGLIDVRQSEILVAGAAQTVPDIERQIEQTENAISILVGRPPAPVTRGRELRAQVAATSLPAGVPSSLLERRPDIQQAEQILAGATARIGVAKTDYFPRVFLSGSVGVGGLMVNGQMFGPQGIFSLLPSLTVPIFNTGRVGAGVDAAVARADEAMLQYQQTIINAFRDVSDSLVEYRKQQEFRVQQEALVVAAVDTTRLANLRYTNGVSTYLEVLDSERQQFDAELGLVRVQLSELLAVVRLYKALGGGWQEARAQ